MSHPHVFRRRARRKSQSQNAKPTTWNDSFHIENNTAGFLQCIHRKCAPWFHSTGRMVIYGFICCIFSCGCKRLCRSGQRPQLTSTPSKERYCCRRRSAEKWYRRSGRRLAYRYPSAARTDLLSPLRGFPPPLPHSRKRYIPCAESLLLWQSLPYPLPTQKCGRLRSASRRTRRCSNGSFHRNASRCCPGCVPRASESQSRTSLRFLPFRPDL